jgi:hypothetical protein
MLLQNYYNTIKRYCDDLSDLVVRFLEGLSDGI